MGWLLNDGHGCGASHLSTWPSNKTSSSNLTGERFVVDDGMDLGVWNDDKLLGDCNVALLPQRR